MRDSHQAVLDAVADELETDETGHGVHHSKRVYNLGMRIAEQEGGDTEIVGAACLVHDLHRVLGDGFLDPRDSLPRVEDVLAEAGFDPELVEDVLHCVAVHEEYSFEDDPEAAETIEAEIVQDADNLDAMGAIGIGRTFRFSGAHGRPMWDPDTDDAPGSYDKEEIDGTTIQHIHEKLLRLRETMNTGTAQRIAEDRHEYMQEFVERFRMEWAGDA